MKLSRRLALVATVAVLGVSACGDPNDATIAADTTAVAGAPAAPAVIHIASAGAGAATAAAPEATGSIVADSKMMAAPFTYRFAGELPALDGEAPSWSFPAGATPTDAQLTALATAFGLDPSVTQLPEDQGGGWQLGSTDYTGPSLTVSKDGMLDWYFSPGPGDTSVGGCAMPETVPVAEVGTEPAPDSTAVAGDTIAHPDPCEVPAPPTGVPTAAEAEAKASDLLASLGIDTATVEFETSADEWGAYVTGWPTLDGHRLPTSFSFGYGAEGALTWANGYLASPQAGPAYPRKGAAAGLQDLQDQSSQWMVGATASAGVADAPVSDTALATDEAPALLPAPVCPDVAVDPAVTDTIVVGGDAVAPAPDTVAPDATIEPMPIDCQPVAMVPIEVTLTGVEEDLTMVWAVDGTVWILPAYTFTSDDGGRYTVIAVEDSFLDAPTS